MEPARELGKGLLILGLVIAAVGVFLLAGARLPFRLGRLPGDISYHGRNTSFYFPIVTCVVLSVVLTLIFWIVGAMRR
jgi:hypothetical protein